MLSAITSRNILTCGFYDSGLHSSCAIMVQQSWTSVSRRLKFEFHGRAHGKLKRSCLLEVNCNMGWLFLCTSKHGSSPDYFQQIFSTISVLQETGLLSFWFIMMKSNNQEVHDFFHWLEFLQMDVDKRVLFLQGLNTQLFCRSLVSHLYMSL